SDYPVDETSRVRVRPASRGFSQTRPSDLSRTLTRLASARHPLPGAASTPLGEGCATLIAAAFAFALLGLAAVALEAPSGLAAFPQTRRRWTAALGRALAAELPHDRQLHLPPRRVHPHQ